MWGNLSYPKYHVDKRTIRFFSWPEPYSDGDLSLIPHSYLLGWKVYGEWSLDVSTATCCWPLASYNKAEQMRHVSNEIQTLLPRSDWVQHLQNKHSLKWFFKKVIYLRSCRIFNVNYFPKKFKYLVRPEPPTPTFMSCLFKPSYNLSNKSLIPWGQRWLDIQCFQILGSEIWYAYAARHGIYTGGSSCTSQSTTLTGLHWKTYIRTVSGEKICLVSVWIGYCCALSYLLN